MSQPYEELSWEHQAFIDYHDLVLERSIECMLLAWQSGAEVSMENPVDYGEEDKVYYWPAMAHKTSIWRTWPVRAFALVTGAVAIDTAMCTLVELLA
eukprot:2392219-Prymnesium_polylepis.1